MSLLKKYAYDEIKSWIKNNTRGLRHYDIMGVFVRVYSRVQSGEKAVSRFRGTGLCPVNRNVFKDYDSKYVDNDEDNRMCNQKTLYQNMNTIAIESDDITPTLCAMRRLKKKSRC